MNQWVGRSILTFWAISSPVNQCLAEEGLTIAELLADPQPYHLHAVELTGTVLHVQPIPPYFLPSGNVGCYGAYKFSLEDDTGQLDVTVLGLCGKPLVREPEVSDGHRIHIQAEIHAPGHHGFFLTLDGHLRLSDASDTMQVIAKRIQPLPQ